MIAGLLLPLLLLECGELGCRMANDAGDSTEVANPSLNPDVCARMVDFMRGQCTAKQWGEWLTVPVELAAARDEKELTEELLRGQAGIQSMRPYELENTTSSSTCARNRSTFTSKLLWRLVMRQWCPCCWSSALKLTRRTIGCTAILFFTPIHLAAKAGQAGIVGVLMDAGACADRWANEDTSTWEQRCDPEYDWSGMLMTENALHLGAIGGHVE